MVTAISRPRGRPLGSPAAPRRHATADCASWQAPLRQAPLRPALLWPALLWPALLWPALLGPALLWPVSLAVAGRPGPAFAALAVTVLAGAMLAGLIAGSALGRTSAAVPLLGRAAALRRKSWAAAFLPQRDPDAAGRARPRAPSAGPAAVS